jgi:hypothetical protein
MQYRLSGNAKRRPFLAQNTGQLVSLSRLKNQLRRSDHESGATNSLKASVNRHFLFNRSRT